MNTMNNNSSAHQQQNGPSGTNQQSSNSSVSSIGSSTSAPDNQHHNNNVRANWPAQPNSLQYQIWAAMNATNFKLKDFITSVDTFTLADDSLASVTNFYDDLIIAVTAAHKESLPTLPPINQLSPSTSIMDIIAPPASYTGYSRAKTFIDNMAKIIAKRLAKPDFYKFAPTAKFVLRSYINSSMHGLDQVYMLLKGRLPFL